MTVRSEMMKSLGSKMVHRSIFWDWENMNITWLWGVLGSKISERYETYNSLDLLGGHRYEEAILMYEEDWK